jgi:hypothetical protein
MQAPHITTAIPKRRYQLGHHGVVVLGDIESPDEQRYRYVLALVREGDSQPSCYVTCVQNRRADSADGAYRLRLICPDRSMDFGSSDDWRDVDLFAAEGLRIVAEALGLGEGQPVRQL